MAAERVQRRLAAILAADVVGYSRLMEADEEGTRARLRSLLSELINPRIATDGGRVVKTTGDGILVEFPSAVDAVRHALEIQGAMRRRNADIPEAARIEFRVGINVGDVMVEGGDIYGDGVNVAARLEGICTPGDVYVSGTVYDQASGKLAATFEDLGEQTVKNIARPVRVYRARTEPEQSSKPDREGEPQPLADRASIAVLPFINMSGDPEQEYFADGIAEDIITALSRFRWFFVTARNSSFIYKGRNVDVREVGGALGVRYVLEGSVRKAGERLRITAQLIEAATGNHLWADRYDGGLEDVFDLQDGIVEGVVGAIEPSVQKAEIERARRKRPESLDAYDLYLQALPRLWISSLADAEEGIALLDEALRIDPSFAAAHGVAAMLHWHRYTRGGLDPTDRAAAVHHSRAVISSASDDANALSQAGFMLASLDPDHEAALGAVEKAVALNPSSARAQTNRSAVHTIMGRYETAIESAKNAIRLNPLDPMRWGPESALAFCYLHTGRHAEAIEAAKRAIQANASFSGAYKALAVGYVRLGRMEEARETVERLRSIEPKSRASSFRTAALGPPDQMEAAIADLVAAGLPE